jgi:hypothetical protein
VHYVFCFLLAWKDDHNFLFFGAHLLYGRLIFTKGRETLSRSCSDILEYIPCTGGIHCDNSRNASTDHPHPCNDLNTTDHNMELTENFSATTKLCNVCTGINFFGGSGI